jgi:hypothetical protein
MKHIVTLLFGLLVLTAVSTAQSVKSDFGVDQKVKLEKGETYQKMVGADDW